MSTSPIQRNLNAIARICALLLFGRGVAGIIGFAFHIPRLVRVAPSEPSITTAALFSYIALALAIWKLQKGHAARWTAIAGIIVGALALSNFFEFGLATLHLIDPVKLLETTSLPSTLSLFALGLCVLCVDSSATVVRRSVHVLLALILALSLTSLIGYSYGFNYLTTLGFPAPFRVENAFLILISSIALVCVRPGEGIFRIIASPTTAGKMARVMLPTVMALPFLGFISGVGKDIASDLLLILNLVLYGLPVLILVSTSILEKVENQRESAYRDVHELNAKLQGQLLELESTAKTLEESLKVRDQVIANVNHELRTPLHSILGVTRLLLSRPRDVGDQEYVHIIQQSAEQLLDRVSRMLMLSELTQRTLPVKPVECDPQVVVERCADSMRWLADRKKLKLCVRHSPDLPSLVRLDESLFESILQSILDNAVRFTDAGEVLLELSLAKLDAQDYLHLCVRDTGTGMTAEQLNQVMIPFEQGDSSFRRTHGGLGLGLALVRRIVDILGGKFQVESMPGVGTTVDVHIPALPAVQAAAASTDKNIVQRAWPRHILIAEDSAVNAVVLQKVLAHSGIAADIVNNGFQAVEAAKTGKYGLILMDVQMPGMDGLEATREIRKCAVPICELPIVAITAHATEVDRRKCLDAGMNDFIAKPVQAAALEGLLTQWLARPAQTENHDVA